jgi:hypothetical protein
MQGRMWREGDLFRASKQTLQSLTLANDAAVAKLSASNSGQSINSGSSGGVSLERVSPLSHSSSRNALNGSTPAEASLLTPQLSRKLNGMSLTGTGGSGTNLNLGSSPTSTSQKSSPYGTRQSTVASLRGGSTPVGVNTGLANSHAEHEKASSTPSGGVGSRSANSTPSAASSAISGYFRKTGSTGSVASPRNNASSVQPTEGDEDDKNSNTQGDLLRIRRQQHINTTNAVIEGGGDSLSNCVTPNSKLSSKDMTFASGANGGGGGSSAKLYGSAGTSGAGTPLNGKDGANTPNSKFGSFLNWNSKV